jgi:23S rRNA pseudouridine1911/1915/1917 synthase
MNPAGDSPLLVVAPEAAGLRIDSYLASNLDGLSRTRIQRSIEDGDILVNDGTVKSGYRVRAGDKVEIDIPPAPPIEIVPEAIPLNVVYEDGDLVVVDKPSGLVVHPGAGNWNGTLVNALVYHFDQLSGAAGRIRPGIVHRIDKDTSGLLVVAKNDPAHERLSDEFRDRKVSKAYIALVYGRIKEARGEIDARIGRSGNNRTRMAAVKEPRGRMAYTSFEVMQQFSDFCLLRVRISTGRTHQIRVHMAHIGHPVVGDAVYGTGREKLIRNPNLRRAVKELGRHFLHSAELAFRHPMSREQLSFTSPIPSRLASFLQNMGE